MIIDCQTERLSDERLLIEVRDAIAARILLTLLAASAVVASKRLR